MKVYVVQTYGEMNITPQKVVGVFSEVSEAHFFGNMHHYEDYFVEEHEVK